MEVILPYLIAAVLLDADEARETAEGEIAEEVAEEDGEEDADIEGHRQEHHPVVHSIRNHMKERAEEVPVEKEMRKRQRRQERGYGYFLASKGATSSFAISPKSVSASTYFPFTSKCTISLNNNKKDRIKRSEEVESQ